MSSSETHILTPASRWAVFIVLSVVALGIRLPRLADRPMHTDESINAYIIGDLLAGKPYHYDPQDRHGPVLYAIAEPIARFGGATNLAGLTETGLRVTPAIIGAATVLLFGAGVELFGFVPCLVAAVLFAFGVLPVYYSRYFIHETPFVAATLGLILAGGRALNKNSLPAAALAGLCAALMFAAKETCVIHFFALGAAAACAFLLPPRVKLPPLKLILTASAAFTFTSVLLFTWFGQNWAVFGDLLQAVPRFTARAGGEGHEKPFGYYLHLIDPMMVLFIVAVGGAYTAICDAVAGARKAPLLLVIYGFLLFLVYSCVPYKTPWLALNLWLPFALMCGFAVEAFWEHLKTSRWIASIAGLFLLAILGAQTKLLAFDKPADEKNPFAYAHTGEDILNLSPRLDELCKKENLTQPRIAVIAADPWPLPWYLRKFSGVGYWQPGQEPGSADFYITTTDIPEELAGQLKNFKSEYFGIRPGVLINLWIATPQLKP